MAVLPASMADLIAATAASEPAGAFFRLASKAAVKAFWASAILPSVALANSALVLVAMSTK